MFIIAFVAACTTGLSVLQEQLFNHSGVLEWKPALAAASTAFLIAFATSVLHLIEALFEPLSKPSQPPQLKK
jgi:TRAP-type C4-dicarboxylate transport system permease small subunit